MIRRSNDALYFTDELIQKIIEHKPVQLWDCVNMFFPKETNKKQFDCALRFIQTLEKTGSMPNTEAIRLFDTQTERYMLTGQIIPKLRKFGFIESDGNTCSKKYTLRFGRKYSQTLRDMGLELFEFYARIVNEKK